MGINDHIGTNFYEAFAAKDVARLATLYHQDLQFYDPAFGTLNREQTLAMWQMLFTASDDLAVSFRVLSTAGDKVVVEWLANYTFGKKRRKVSNRVVAELILADNKIIKHTDHFNLHRWATQALGTTGLLIGWTNFFKQKLQRQTKARLLKFMRRED